MKGGYYTVEAVFVMMICIWVVIALCVGGLYIHDRVVLVSETNEVLSECIEEDEKYTASQVEERLRKQLFFLHLEKVSAKDGLTGRKVTVKYTLFSYPVLLKKIWLEGKEHAEYTAVRTKRKPTEYRWDAEMAD